MDHDSKVFTDRRAQAEQHTVLESKGTAHGKHFDLKPLLDALKTYVDNAAKWNYDQRAIDQWCKKVGGAQKLLPAHVVNEYCRPDRSFDPCPSEWTSLVPRTQAVTDLINSKWVKGSWFTPPTPYESLGSSFAFYRARVGSMCWRGWRGERGVLRTVAIDLKGLQALWNARTQQLKALVETLMVESQSPMWVGLK